MRRGSGAPETRGYGERTADEDGNVPLILAYSRIRSIRSHRMFTS